MLIVIGGLPGTGKTTLARLLAARIRAVYLRVDTIEQAVVRSGLTKHPVGPVGYVVGYALAREQLQQGLTVVAESVNPLAITRDSWLGAAQDAGAPAVEVEVVCSNPVEHRERIVSRSVDIPGLPLPGWPDVLDYDYQPWNRDHIVLDTAGENPDESLYRLLRRPEFGALRTESG
ncbi:AAA family ATPase [Nocardia sp. NBC_01499]|uniref:AAA family ATPase n=1 Tax=Nocardia sp. NBC_01499 TaxID=2903597 RepID=UPI0038649C3A